MSSVDRATIREQYERDGYLIVAQPILPAQLVNRALEGMDAIRAGEYETGRSPQPSSWNPGDDPRVLCKIEMPQIANEAIRALVGHPLLGEWAAAITGATMVQAWWVQLLYKPSSDGSVTSTNVGWHQDLTYWSETWEPGSELFTAWVA